MSYIGRSTDGFGVRNRFIYLASSGDTSVSGADSNGATLTFTDGAYVDVYLNGVLLKPTTDYNTTTANTIAGLSALNTNDEVTVVVYDVFTVGDMVSATSGGTFSGAVTFSGGVSSSLTVANGLTLTDGNVTVASGHGIDFSATSDATGMSSELFDDYEEGTWTPAWTGGISSPTYSIQHGRYTKTGNVCTAYLYLTITNGTDGSAVAVIGGLPFTSAATMYWVATGYNNSSDNNNDNVIVICFPGTTSLYFYSQGLQGVSQIPGNNLGNTTSQLWQITYRTA